METLGKFEILEKVGKGAMGEVCKARDPFIGRLVALKTITASLADDPVLLQKFYKEARSAGALEHPNIVTIYELGKEGNTPFIAMQFVDGGSLEDLLKRRSALPLSQKVGFIVYVCRALEYAHKHGVIHRDIKPGNVMLMADGTVKVVDFGIARFGDSSTHAGMIIGTLAYMAPQLYRNIDADARSDIWATGIMFYEILAGQRPFLGDNAGTLMGNILMQELPSITAAAPGTPPEVAAVLERMLKKEAEQRYQSMDEVLMALEPVWKDLQREEVSRLVQDGQDLKRKGDLWGAQAKFKEACKLDTAYTQARNALDQVSAEIKKNQIRPQAEKLVRKSQEYLEAGQLEEAKAEAVSAKQLDPTFHLAQEMLERVQAAEDRAREIALALNKSKQRLAEGSFTEAELQLTRVLQIDATNAVAQDLLKQIREEKLRRERQRRLSETLHLARTLWTELHYDECIELLLVAEQEFPAEPKIKELLETARQDQAEQVKQSLLAEARNLLRSQQFVDALTTLDRVLQKFPSDVTAKNLRTLAVQGLEQQIRELKLKEDLKNLRALVNAEKYQEAITRGEQLLLEFPKEFELTELVTYARSEQARLEQKRRLEGWLEKVNQGIGAGRFAEAIQAAEKALGEFPRNADLQLLLDKAKKQREEKQKRELLEKRIKEIKNRVNRDELTDAIQLAQQTLITHGPDTDISQLLHQSQEELRQREQKKQEQEVTLLEARTLLDEGKPGDATLVLDGALATRILTDSDPRLKDLLREIDKKKAASRPVRQPVDPRHAAPVHGSTSASTAGSDKDHVYQQTVRLPDNQPVGGDSATPALSATIVIGPSVQPIIPSEVKPREDPDKLKTQVQTPVQTDDARATVIVPQQTRELEVEPSPDLAPPPIPPTPAPRPETLPEPAARPFWKQPVGIAITAVLVLAIGGGAVYYSQLTKSQPPTQPPTITDSPPPPPPHLQPGSDPAKPPPPQPVDPMIELGKQQDALINQATRIAGTGDYDGAINKLNDADKFHGPRTAKIDDLRKVYNEDKTNRGLADLRQKEQRLWDDAFGHFGNSELDQAQQIFQQIVTLPDGGIYKKDAQDYITTKIPTRREAERLFEAATQQSKQAKDETGWEQVSDNIQLAMNKGLSERDTLSAQTLLKTASNNLGQLKEERETFGKLQSQFNDPATKGNKSALESLLDEFRKLGARSERYKQESGTYQSKIEAMLTELSKPPVTPPSPNPVTPAPNPPPPPVYDPKPDIAKVIDVLSRGFQYKKDNKIDEIKLVWPSIPKQQEATLRSILSSSDLKNYSRKFKVEPANIAVNGDNATVSGTWADTNAPGGSPPTGSFKATLKKTGARWIIDTLTM